MAESTAAAAADRIIREGRERIATVGDQSGLVEALLLGTVAA